MQSSVARGVVALALIGCSGLGCDAVEDVAPPIDAQVAPLVEQRIAKATREVVGPQVEADREVSEFVAIPRGIDIAPVPTVTFERPDALLEEGFARHQEGDYKSAVALFDRVARTLPVARALSARSMMEDGRLAEAYTTAVSVARENEQNPMAWFVLGLVAFREGRLDEAGEAYHRVLDLDRDNAAAHNNLGSIYYHREDFSRARTELDRALAFATDDFSRSIAEANLAELDALSGRLDLAEERLDRALGLAPNEAHSYFGLATLYDVTGREHAALTMAETGLELDGLGETRRSISFVWPELELHNAGLLAEARGDTAVAVEKWTELLAIEQSRSLEWSPLAGRAAAHLGRLGDPLQVAADSTVQGAAQANIEPVDAAVLELQGRLAEMKEAVRVPNAHAFYCP